MQRLLLKLLFLFALSPFSQAQSYTTWLMTDSVPAIGHQIQFNSITRVPGNGYIVCGVHQYPNPQPAEAILVRLDESGAVLWDREYPFFGQPPFSIITTTSAQFWSAHLTPDGGFVLGLSQNITVNNNWLVKVDAMGDTLWTHSPGLGTTTAISSIDVLPNGNVVYCAGEPMSGSIDPKLVWMSPNGTVIRDSSYTGLNYLQVNELETDADQNIYIVGQDSVDQLLVTKFDSLGNLLWHQGIWNNPDSTYLWLQHVEVMADSNIFVGCTYPDASSNRNYAILLSMRPNGTIEWQQHVPDSVSIPGNYIGSTRFNPMTIRSDGNIMLGMQEMFDYDLYCFSPTGNFLWGRTLPKPPGIPDPNIPSFAPGPDASLVVAGAYLEMWGFNGYAAAYDSLGDFKYAHVQGTVHYDSIANCTQEPSEPGIGNSLIVNSFGGVTDITNAQGNFDFIVGTGTHTFTVHPAGNVFAPLWGVSCPSNPDSITVTYSGTPAIDTLPGNDFALEKLVECPLMFVDIGVPFLRNCVSNNTYSATYCNFGTLAADSAYVILTIDTALAWGGATLPSVMLSPDSIRIELGTVPVGFCGTFQFAIASPCNPTFNGQTYCVEAHAYPDSLCVPAQNWNGAEVAISGTCTNDTVWFTVSNKGSAAMSQSSTIWVVEDDILRQTSSAQLNAGQDSTFFIVGNGSTWTVRAEQEPNYPWPSHPTASVEACATNGQGGISTGFVTQFPNDDGAPYLSIECTQLIGSFDPNDKRGFPLGTGPDHDVLANGQFEYMIRFQNTGTDTAFKVVIRDEMPAELDMLTFVPGTSSHPYSINMLPGNVVEWTFQPIALPDSNVNEPASHGFVKFQVRQQPNLPVGTRIENEAAIFFDFNPAVITDVAFHTIAELEIMLTIDEATASEAAHITVYPNPFTESATIDLGGHFKDVQLQVFDLNGRLLRMQQAGSTREIRVDRNGLAEGMYVYRITAKDQVLGSGKVIVRNR